MALARARLSVVERRWTRARGVASVASAVTEREPRSRDGVSTLATFAMTTYWRCGQTGFFDAATPDAALDLGTPLGFEPLVGDGGELRRRTLAAFAGANLRARTWLDGVDEGNGRTTRAGVFTSDDWIIVAFRGTTPSPLRGLIFESQINGRAGQKTWGEAGRVHAGYAAAYDALRAKVEDAVKAEMDACGGEKRLVVTGHSLGGALATLCAARLARAYGPEGARVDAVTFGQPRVGDSEFVRYLDVELANALSYARVVHGADLFARVPTSGYWLPSANEGRFGVEYAHAGSMLWTNASKGSMNHVYAAKGAGEPEGFSLDARMANPARVALDHSGYARFFDEDPSIFDQWPDSGLL